MPKARIHCCSGGDAGACVKGKHLVDEAHGKSLLGRVQASQEPHLSSLFLSNQAHHLCAAVPSIKRANLGAGLAKHAIISRNLNPKLSERSTEHFSVTLMQQQPAISHANQACQLPPICHAFISIRGLQLEASLTEKIVDVPPLLNCYQCKVASVEQ